jgi:hypothetical protein
MSCLQRSIWYDMIYLTATGLTPGGSSTVHIYTQTIIPSSTLVFHSRYYKPIQHSFMVAHLYQSVLPAVLYLHPLYQFYAYWWGLAPPKRPNWKWVGFSLPLFWPTDRNKASLRYVLFFTLLYFNHYHGARAPVGQGPLIIKDSWSHSDTPHSVKLLWTSDQSDAETSTWQHTTLTTNIQTSMPLAGFKPIISASEQPQTLP